MSSLTTGCLDCGTKAKHHQYRGFKEQQAGSPGLEQPDQRRQALVESTDVFSRSLGLTQIRVQH